jgi:hypothetical protein
MTDPAVNQVREQPSLPTKVYRYRRPLRRFWRPT